MINLHCARILAYWFGNAFLLERIQEIFWIPSAARTHRNMCIVHEFLHLKILIWQLYCITHDISMILLKQIYVKHWPHYLFEVHVRNLVELWQYKNDCNAYSCKKKSNLVLENICEHLGYSLLCEIFYPPLVVLSYWVDLMWIYINVLYDSKLASCSP